LLEQLDAVARDAAAGARAVSELLDAHADDREGLVAALAELARRDDAREAARRAAAEQRAARRTRRRAGYGAAVAALFVLAALLWSEALGRIT